MKSVSFGSSVELVFRLIMPVSLCVQLDDSFSMQRSGSLDFYQHPTMYWIRYGRFPKTPYRRSQTSKKSKQTKIMSLKLMPPSSLRAALLTGYCCAALTVSCFHCSVVFVLGFCFFSFTRCSLQTQIPYSTCVVVICLLLNPRLLFCVTVYQCLLDFCE